MMKKRFIISGGGTGGHIYPAISIANELKAQYPDAEFLFIGAKDKMEMQKVPQAGYKIEGLWISGFHRKLTHLVVCVTDSKRHNLVLMGRACLPGWPVSLSKPSIVFNGFTNTFLERRFNESLW